MLAIPCPKCFQSLAIREEALGRKVRCVCGHRFIAEDPSSPSANGRLADGEPTDPSVQSHASINMSSAFPTLLGSRRSGEANPTSKSPLPVPPRGSIGCPYCGCLVVEDAKLLGQSILCPKCHANFNAPDSRQTSFQTITGIVFLKLIGCILLGVGCIGAFIALNMDTTVGVESQIGGWTHVDRVHNIGRMDARCNWLIVSGLVVITGGMFVGFGFLADKGRPTIPSLQLAVQQFVTRKRSSVERVLTVLLVVVVCWIVIVSLIDTLVR